MPSHNPIPLATCNVQCLKCSKPISENQSYSQCDTCMQNIHSTCISGKKSNSQSFSNNRQFTCNKCSQCPICIRKVAKNHKAVLCELCNSWVHIKCNKLSIEDYKLFQNNPNLNFTCLKCNESSFPYISPALLSYRQLSYKATKSTTESILTPCEVVVAFSKSIFLLPVSYTGCTTERHWRMYWRLD